MNRLLIIVLAFFINQALEARSIYGEDDRREVGASSLQFQKMAKSTAAMISKRSLKKYQNQFRIEGSSYREKDQLCSEERFQNQVTAATCSGTLVAPDIILTAAHCVLDEEASCENYSWVFDYRHSQATPGKVMVSKKSVFSCKEIIKLEFDIENGLDYALIKLDRPSERTPIKIETEEPVLGEPLVIIGHPRGLPTKIAAGAFITALRDGLLWSNVDAYGGNSGGGVFSARTGNLISIVSYGEEDYIETGICHQSAVYEMDLGGEASTFARPAKVFLDSIQQ